ncbi:MAG: hypothetical protein JXR51_03185 [Bacteroidales bacterium]|nr:hypothetical protein [Bacteroidales bacterium]MBN2756155.1 hypothetical protein [Bacteroidales bacterium]
MAKEKKKLSEIRDALFSNTSFLNDDNKDNISAKKTNDAEIQAELSDNFIEIDKQTLAKLKLLANYHNQNYKDLIDEALAHYLRIKKLDLDEALKNIVVGNAEDE